MCNFYLSLAAHVSEQIHPGDTLACFWDVEQPENNNCHVPSAVVVGKIADHAAIRHPLQWLMRWQMGCLLMLLPCAIHSSC